MVDFIDDLVADSAEFSLSNPLSDRYDLPMGTLTGEEYIEELGNVRYNGDIERAARQLLNDFRTGKLGSMPLELPSAN